MLVERFDDVRCSAPEIMIAQAGIHAIWSLQLREQFRHHRSRTGVVGHEVPRQGHHVGLQRIAGLHALQDVIHRGERLEMQVAELGDAKAIHRRGQSRDYDLDTFNQQPFVIRSNGCAGTATGSQSGEFAKNAATSVKFWHGSKKKTTDAPGRARPSVTMPDMGMIKDR